jgi:hypothetical protein
VQARRGAVEARSAQLDADFARLAGAALAPA